MITLRLDPKLEKTINNIAHQMGISRSELIQKSISDFIGKLGKPSPWELAVIFSANMPAKMIACREIEKLSLKKKSDLSDEKDLN